MRIPAFFISSCFFFTVSPMQIDFSTSPTDLFHDDSQLFATEPQVEEIDSLDQSFGSDIDLFSEDYQLLPPVEPDPSSVLADIDMNHIGQSDLNLLAADDTVCDSSNAGYNQMFGKNRRRGDTCKSPPVGEAEGHLRQPDDGDKLDLGFTNFATIRRTMTVFPSNYDICPYERFFGANIPVCKEPNPLDVSKVAGVPWFNLRNVVPRTFH